jgi:hypothetical protein
LYIGPPFYIHYKYALVMNLVFVPFIWGGVMPVLFPIATVGLIIMYVVERLMVYYSYEHPPMLDDALSVSTIQTFFLCPVAMCMITGWAFSNQSVYFNKVNEQDHTLVFPRSEHYMRQFFTQLSPATPLVLFWILFVVFTLLIFCGKTSLIGRILCRTSPANLEKITSKKYQIKATIRPSYVD